MIGVESIKPWSGHSSGQFHIDFLGVKTDARFWKGIQPSPAGWRRTSAPGLSQLYFEYAACIMACSALGGRPFRALEIGGGWGVWSVRAALVAQRLGTMVRTAVIEMMPEQCRQIGRHFMANGLHHSCHQIIGAAVSADGADGWIRMTDPFDPGARLVHEDWARRHAILSPGGMAFGVQMPCRDGSSISRISTRRLRDLVSDTAVFDFVHLCIGPGPQKLLDDPVLSADRVGVLVIPNINAVDLPLVAERMARTTYTCVGSLDAGAVLRSLRGEATVRNALRIYAGDRISQAHKDAMEMYFSGLSA